MPPLAATTELSPAPSLSEAQLLWLTYDVSLAFAAILVSTDALNRFGLAAPMWLMAYGMALLRIALQPTLWFNILRRNANVLIYPAVCIASVLWSVSRGVSLPAAVQVSMTIVIAIVVGARFRIRTLIFFIFGVTLLCCLLSLVNWRTGMFGNVWAGSGGLLGIFTQKNQLGQRMFVGVVSIVALMLMNLRYGNALRPVLFVSLAAMLFTLYLSRSVTSWLLLVPFTGLLVAMCYHRLNTVVLVATLVVGILILATGPLALALANINPVTAVLHAVQKSETLTGRTDLWTIAEMVLRDYYFLGVGYMAFWQSAQFANMTFLAQEIGGEMALGFHNFILDIWVGTGLFGLGGMVLLLWVAASRSFRAYLQTADVSFAYAFVLVLAAIGLSLFGPNLYRQHEFFIMIVVMLSVSSGESLRRLRLERGASRSRDQRLAGA